MKCWTAHMSFFLKEVKQMLRWPTFKTKNKQKQKKKRRKNNLIFKLLHHENGSKSPNWYDCTKLMKKIVLYIYIWFKYMVFARARNDTKVTKKNKVSEYASCNHHTNGGYHHAKFIRSCCNSPWESQYSRFAESRNTWTEQQ